MDWALSAIGWWLLSTNELTVNCKSSISFFIPTYPFLFLALFIHRTRYQWMIFLLREWINSLRECTRADSRPFVTTFYPLWKIGTPYMFLLSYFLSYFLSYLCALFLSKSPSYFFSVWPASLSGGYDVMRCMPLSLPCVVFSCISACKKGRKIGLPCYLAWHACKKGKGKRKNRKGK